jgi:predicted TIM-barrel fold metal-dependent hydrolase
VHIEAGFDNQQPWREIDWLEQHCTGNFKTVAFADITSTSFAKHLQQLKQRKSVVGIRHILDDQAQPILNSESIHRHFALLAEMALSFDAQLSLTDSHGVDLLVGLAKQHKTVSIIVNHGGWPPAENNLLQRKEWMLNLQKLAKCENIAIKLSGWEMPNRNWQPQHLATVLQDSLEVMGDTRVMLASNFPLCIFSMSYSELWNTYAALTSLSHQTFEKLTFSNANKWYKF